MNIKGMKRDEQLQALHTLGLQTGGTSSSVATNAAVHKKPDGSGSSSSKGSERSIPATTLFPISTRSKMPLTSPKKLGGIASNVKSLFANAKVKHRMDGYK